MAHPRLARLELAPGKRIIAVSDIHAHLSLLDALLAKLNFSPEKDFLIVIGDVIEDGGACLASLRRVMALEKAGCARVTAGNWDYFIHIWLTSDDPADNLSLLRRTIELRDQNGSSLFSDMCLELGITLTPDTDMPSTLALVRERFAEEIAFMGSMPIVLDCGDFVCVHGGLTSLESADIEAEPDSHSFLKNDAFASQGYSFDRWVIVGHWPVANYDSGIPRLSPHIFEKQRIVSIDGGCGKLYASQLNALIMRAGDIGHFDWDYADDLPRATSLDAQEASSDPIHTTWHTRFIDVLRMDGDTALVRHHATGRLLEVPVKRLWQQGDTTVLGDYTDYRLPISPGDEISILLKTSRGLLCKKKDVSGWYTGRYILK